MTPRKSKNEGEAESPPPESDHAIGRNAKGVEHAREKGDVSPGMDQDYFYEPIVDAGKALRAFRTALEGDGDHAAEALGASEPQHDGPTVDAILAASVELDPKRVLTAFRRAQTARGLYPSSHLPRYQAPRPRQR